MAGIDLRVTGADDLAALGRDLRGACNAKQLRSDIHRAANRATKPVKPLIIESASVLPGGLAPWVQSRMKVTTKTRTSGALAGVRFTTRRPKPGGSTDVKALNRGQARHPLWGNKGFWYGQAVPAQWIDKVMTGPAADQAVTEFLAMVEVIRGRIARG